MITIFNLPSSLQRLAQLGNPGAWEALPWLKYETLGIGKEHIPDLIDILNLFDDFWEQGPDSPLAWTPMHAWRALGQLQATEALPVMIGLLERLNEQDIVRIQEDLPRAIALIGLPAVPVLLEYLLDGQHGLWSRAAVVDALHLVAQNTPQACDQVAAGLALALENFAANRPVLNGLLIKGLKDLHCSDAAGLVEQAYAAGQVDESICGDWQDYQVAVGLLKKRQTAPLTRPVSPAAFLDGLAPEEQKTRQRIIEKIREKRKKPVRKQPKESRGQKKIK